MGWLPAALQQHRKLVAAQSRHRENGAQRIEPVSDLAKHPVAHLVPECVVDMLEIVQIDENQSEGPRHFVTALGQRLQVGLEAKPVAHLRQRIGVGQALRGFPFALKVA